MQLNSCKDRHESRHTTVTSYLPVAVLPVLAAVMQRALWDAEVLLMGNAAAAHLKLGSFRAAAEACEKLLSR